MTPGEIRLVWFPFSKDEAEPYKKRPVLIVNAVGYEPDRPVLVAMITSNARRVARPSSGDVVIDDWQGSGLRLPSVVRTRRIWTAEERDFAGPMLGCASSVVLRKVRDEIRTYIQ